MKKGIDQELEEEGKAVIATLNKEKKKKEKPLARKGIEMHQEDMNLDEDEEIVETKEKGGTLDTVVIASKAGNKKDKAPVKKFQGKNNGNMNDRKKFKRG